MKAARSLLAWSQEELADASGVSIPTIKRLEAVDGELGGRSATGEKIVSTLEAAGVYFIPENGGGAGVRLRKPSPADQERTNLMHAVDLVEEAGGSLLEASLPLGLRVSEHGLSSTVDRAIAAGLVRRDGQTLRRAPKPTGPATDVVERMEAEIAADRGKRTPKA